MYKVTRVLVFSLFFLSNSPSFASGDTNLNDTSQNNDYSSSYSTDSSPQWISNHDFVYNSDLSTFNLQEYLTDNAPHLLQYAELISHWSGYYSINPKVLITLIEMQSGLITHHSQPELPQNPLDKLAKGVDFSAQVKDVLSRLYSDFYAYQQPGQQRSAEPNHASNAATHALMNLFKDNENNNELAARASSYKDHFTDTFQQLFPEQSRAEANRAEDYPQGALPPTGFLQLPWKIGTAWAFGGVHTSTGSQTGIMSSLDFYDGGPWGTDTSNDFVVAAHPGTVTVFSSCYVRITATNGWMTSYYHLDNLVVNTGDTVTANQTIGVYADNQAQALCDGGSSNGPHVHFSLLNNGTYASLSGVDLSGYVVHPGRWSYDTHTDYMWLERDGTKYYAYGAEYNDNGVTRYYFNKLRNNLSLTPAATTLNSPTGTISDSTPTYSWNAVSNATWYYLWVDDSTGNRIKQWYTAAQAGCDSGTGTCSVTPSVTLANGNGSWWIQTWNASGYGDWSPATTFTVSVGGSPGVATLNSPAGTISNSAPTYSWNAVSNSSWYYLWVDDSAGNRIKQWYTAAQAGCDSGTGTCSVTPSVTLANGSGSWWIQTWNASGYGDWSSANSFILDTGAPRATTAVAPAGLIVNSTPTYSWNAVSNSSWYYLWVDDSTGNRIKQWYTAAQAGCDSGTGTCSVTPSVTLANGSGSWWIQTWNASGYGDWNSGTSFTLD